MRKAYLVYCECGTPLLRETRYHMTADAWAKAYESGDPNAKIKLKQFYQYHRWHPSLIFPDGSYDVEEASITECPACHIPLSEKVAPL